MKTSPTQRSLKLLKEAGYTCQVVERWCAFSRRRIDLFGFIDIVAVKVGESGVLAVQTTTAPNLSARRNKIEAEARAGIWLAAGNRIALHGWKKRSVNGRKIWDVRLEMMPPPF